MERENAHIILRCRVFGFWRAIPLFLLVQKKWEKETPKRKTFYKAVFPLGIPISKGDTHGVRGIAASGAAWFWLFRFIYLFGGLL